MVETFTFDDILIEPHASSTIKSRDDVDTSTPLSNGVELDLPVISASMSAFDTLQPDSRSIYYQFADVIADEGGMHIFSRATLFESRLRAATAIALSGNPVGIAVSLQEFSAYRKALESLPNNVVVSIDIANGAIIDEITWTGDNLLVIGNFGNKKAMKRNDSGNVIHKYGLGAGAACTTRMTTGVGAPQAWLIDQIRKEYQIPNYRFISDGGIDGVSDFVKALALGADFVMMGKLLAATRESPWSPVKIDDKWYKPYRGMASAEEKGRYSHIEGVSGHILYEDKSVSDVMRELRDGLTSAMSYTNSEHLVDFHYNSSFLKVSNASRFESDHRLLLT